jgi:hypothetical protein
MATLWKQRKLDKKNVATIYIIIIRLMVSKKYIIIMLPLYIFYQIAT